MELYAKKKLRVVLDDKNELTITEKSGCMCIKEENVSKCNLADVIDMVPDKGGSCVAIAAKNDDFYLKMNKTAVSTLLGKWEAMPKDYTKEVLFEKSNVICYITTNGYLSFVTKSKGACCSKSISAFCISMADVVLMDVHHKMLKGDTFFLSTVEHAIELNKIEQETISRLTEEIQKSGATISEMKTYERSFRFCLPIKREIEYIYTTPMGVAHYYKKNSKSNFRFIPWDSVTCTMATEGWFTKRMLVLSEDMIITKCAFPAGNVNEIVTFINSHVEENAGSGKLFGRGKNKVYVTDTHVLCIGKNTIKALEKPYEEGQLVKQSWCSSIVNLSGFNVKVGRYAWKAFCCGKGKLYRAVTESPSRELKGSAEKHKF